MRYGTRKDMLLFLQRMTLKCKTTNNNPTKLSKPRNKEVQIKKALLSRPYHITKQLKLDILYYQCILNGAA